jgi:predicted TIM-barrel fold metal-dependent hydrolase
MNGNGFYGSGQPKMADYTYLIMDRNQKLDQKQKILMEEFPDRFVVGSDVAHTIGMKNNNIARNMNAMRLLLSQINPQAASKIAYKNAIRIFDLPLTFP